MEEWTEREDLRLAGLLHWPTCFSVGLVCQVPREGLLEVRAWTMGRVGRVLGGEDWPDLVEMGPERKRRPWPVVCYRDGTGASDLKKWTPA